MSERAERPYDLVVFGATSFVGQILTRHLVDRADGVSWAIAGRDPGKLATVADETGADVDRIVADAGSDDDMRDVAESTRTVVSTVGPYALHGSGLVASVAAAGTDYCDLTGEPQWMKRMIDAHHDTAVGSGSRIVHACGFDSIPSDLGVWFTQQQALERFGEPCTEISLRVERAKGGASGGTLASGLNLAQEARSDPSVRKVLADPYCLCPAELATGPRQPNVTLPARDSDGRWLAPFVMAATNTRIVHRSHALMGRPWGPGFEYSESMAMGDGTMGLAKASLTVAALAAFTGAVAFGPSRRLVAKLVPQPGEGPSPEAQQAGYFVVRLRGRTAAGDTIVTEVAGDRDPGYGSTARMLAEAALAFDDVSRDEVSGGFWTPATMFGERLIERLVAHAGLTFDVVG